MKLRKNFPSKVALIELMAMEKGEEYLMALELDL